jgi:hypothetical protein
MCKERKKTLYKYKFRVEEKKNEMDINVKIPLTNNYLNPGMYTSPKMICTNVNIKHTLVYVCH